MKGSSSELKSKSGSDKSAPRLRLSASTQFLAAFTALFAVLAAFVFWGTWTPDAAPVMPDNPIWHPLARDGQLAAWFRGWLGTGRFTPIDLWWSDGFVSGYWMQEFKYALSVYLAALALAYFLRGRGLSRLASYGAGLLLGFCGYWMTLFSAGHGGWFQWMSYGVFAFGLIDRALARGAWRHWILLGAVVAWGSFNQPDLWLLFTAFTGVYFLYRLIVLRRSASAVAPAAGRAVAPRPPDVPSWAAWGKGVGVAALVCALIGLPSFREHLTGTLAGRDKQIEESKGSALAGGKGATKDGASDEEKAKADAEARWIFTTNWSMPPEDTLEFFIPRIHGDTSCPMTLQLGRAAGRDVRPYTGRLGRPLGAPRGNYRQHSLYVGWVTCLLALVGIVAAVGRARSTHRAAATSSKSPYQGPDGGQETSAVHLHLSPSPSPADVLFFAVAALVFWLFSMGRFCESAYRLVYALPFGDYLRAPVKWHHLTEFCLCVLAGFGIDALFGWLRARGCGEKIAFALVAALVVFGATDLARNDRLFCAPIDLTVVRARNAAADEVARRGNGAVCDLLEGGNGLLSWSFAARGVGMTREIGAPGVRFVWTSLEMMKRNPQLAGWLKQRATLAGLYLVTPRGVSGAPQDRANAALYQVNGVPPPPKDAPRPPVKGGVLALGLISFAGTLAALAALARRR